jgi:DNA-binding response OmpR family regulator
MAKILVADDDAEIRDSLRLLMEQEGHRVICVSDGREALVKIRDEKPALAILDIVMPGLDGFKLARLLRESPPAPRIIFLTSRNLEWDRKVSDQVGAEAYLNKPVRPEEFLAKVKQVLEA